MNTQEQKKDSGELTLDNFAIKLSNENMNAIRTVNANSYLYADDYQTFDEPYKLLTKPTLKSIKQQQLLETQAHG